MMDRSQVERIAKALEAIRRSLEELAQAGEGIPAVEKNALRMKGTLRSLEVQFNDLADMPP